MASTFSPSLRLELIGDGDQSGIWGQTTNNNLGALIEQAISGVVTITMADANYTLTNFNGVADEARNQVIVLTGTNTTQRNLIAPLVEKTYTIKNSTIGGFAVQIIGSSGAGVIIPNGVTTTVYCDGTDFQPALSGVSGNFAVSGNAVVAGSLTGTTATFSGAISSVSPSFTGVPTAPTAAPGTNTTQIATTAFVLVNGVPAGGIIMWSGSIASIPTGFRLCDGTGGTPDLRDRFIIGAGSTYAPGATGGSTTSTPTGTVSGSTGGTGLTEAQMPKHFHRYVTGHLAGGSWPNGGQSDQNGLFFGGTPDDGAFEYFSYSVGGDAGSGSKGQGTANGSPHSHTISGATLSGNPMSILPTFFALAYIMKI